MKVTTKRRRSSPAQRKGFCTPHPDPTCRADGYSMCYAKRRRQFVLPLGAAPTCRECIAAVKQVVKTHGPKASLAIKSLHALLFAEHEL